IAPSSSDTYSLSLHDALPILNYASAGAGSPHHLAMELLNAELDLGMVHIPYKGAAPSLTDVAGGQVPIMMVDLAAGAGFLQGGRSEEHTSELQSRENLVCRLL